MDRGTFSQTNMLAVATVCEVKISITAARVLSHDVFKYCAEVNNESQPALYCNRTTRRPSAWLCFFGRLRCTGEAWRLGLRKPSDPPPRSPVPNPDPNGKLQFLCRILARFLSALCRQFSSCWCKTSYGFGTSENQRHLVVPSCWSWCI